MTTRKPIVFLSDNSLGELPATDDLAIRYVEDLPLPASSYGGTFLQRGGDLYFSNGSAWQIVTLSPVPVPVNTVPPVVSGASNPGDTATVTNGTWTNSPIVYTRQWQEFIAEVWLDIFGETNTTYETDHVGIFRCVVTATNEYGSGVASSNEFEIAESSGTDIDWGDTGSGGGGAWPTSGDRALLVKITASNTLTLTQFNMRTTASSTGSANDRFKGLVYADDGTGGNPGTLIGVSDPTNPTNSSGSNLLTASCSITVPPGDYWIGYVCDGGSGTGSITDSGGTNVSGTIMLNSGETDYASPNDPAGNWPGSPGPYSNVPALWFDGTY